MNKKVKKEETKAATRSPAPVKSTNKPAVSKDKPATSKETKASVKQQAPKQAIVKSVTPAKSPAKPKEVKQATPSKSAAPLAHGVGRRKSSVARVWLKRGNGSLTVNKKDYAKYFDTETARLAASLPFHAYPQASRYDIEVNVCGGGIYSQADAVKLGISRALVKINEEIRPVLRNWGLLTVDSRVKERKKYGQKGARRRFQFVKR